MMILNEMLKHSFFEIKKQEEQNKPDPNCRKCHGTGKRIIGKRRRERPCRCIYRKSFNDMKKAV